MINLEINENKLQEISKKLVAEQKHIKTALGRAIRKTAQWIRTISVREISKLTNIQQKIVRRRVRVYIEGSRQLYAKVYYGQDPIAMVWMNPKQNKRGVKAGKNFVKSAFIASIKQGGKPNVYKRVGKERFPVTKQVVEIENESNTVINDHVFDGFEKKFFEIFERELRWETSKN